MAEEDILHQTDVEGVIGDVIEEGVGKDNAAIDDASEDHALAGTFSDTEVEAALDALGATINLILAALRTNGIVLVAEE